MSASVVQIPSSAVLDHQAAPHILGRQLSHGLLTFARQQPVGAVSLLLLAVFTLVAVFAPSIAPYDPNVQILQRRYAAPLTEYALGGDQFGRDVLSRIIFGARVSLLVGLLSTLIGGGIGAVLGLASGYFGGSVDMIMQRVVDTVQSIPSLILAMVFVVAFSPSIGSVIFAIALPTIPLSTRIIRSVTLQIRALDYVTAARAVGASHLRIMRLHIFPQTIAPLTIVLSSRVGQAIITEATLGFIGLGVPPPTATWGQMLADATKAFFIAPWISIFPGLALSLAVFSVNLLGDAIRDTLDPRLRSG